MDERLKVLIALQMRYKVTRVQASAMGEAWLAANPGQTWIILNELIQSSQVVVSGDQLVSTGETLPPQTSPPQASPPQAAAPPSNKPQRMYRGRPI